MMSMKTWLTGHCRIAGREASLPPSLHPTNAPTFVVQDYFTSGGAGVAPTTAAAAAISAAGTIPSDAQSARISA